MLVSIDTRLNDARCRNLNFFVDVVVGVGEVAAGVAADLDVDGVGKLPEDLRYHQLLRTRVH